jgi:hypothetical protein
MTDDFNDKDAYDSRGNLRLFVRSFLPFGLFPSLSLLGNCCCFHTFSPMTSKNECLKSRPLLLREVSRINVYSERTRPSRYNQKNLSISETKPIAIIIATRKEAKTHMVPNRHCRKVVPNRLDFLVLFMGENVFVPADKAAPLVVSSPSTKQLTETLTLWLLFFTLPCALL